MKKAYLKKSRQVLTSGALEAVPDNSEFSYMLKMVLLNNTHPFMDPLMMYHEIRQGVTSSLPLLGSIAGAGHQNGASLIWFLNTL